ncbi:MAG TPA: hypothetical protein VK471_00955 [Solirubrobacterales bacterium]|nr:hypothetical protein [Solirubrobacterales bacterium]
MRLTKLMGLAIGMAMLITAVAGATSASAAQFRAEEYPTSLKGTQTSTYKLKAGNNASLQCSTVNETATLSAPASSVTMTPELKVCQFAGTNATVTINSCQYVLNSTSESEYPQYDEPPPAVPATFAVACSVPGDAIEIKVLGGCILKVPAQTGLQASLTDSKFTDRSSNRNITQSVNATGVKYSSTSCLGLSNGLHEDGTWTGSSVLTGANGGYAVGVYLANQQIEPPLVFSTEGYSWSIESESAVEMKMNMGGTGIECSAFKANGSLPVASDRLGLSVSQWTCALGNQFNVNMNGCTLEAQATGKGHSSAWGVLNVNCPGGAAITFSALWGTCNVSIPAQTNRSGLTFETIGSGASRKVDVGMNVTGLKYTGSSGLSWCQGTHEDLSLTLEHLKLQSPGQGFFIII